MKIFVKRKCDVILYIFLKISIITHAAVFAYFIRAYAARGKRFRSKKQEALKATFVHCFNFAYYLRLRAAQERTTAPQFLLPIPYSTLSLVIDERIFCQLLLFYRANSGRGYLSSLRA